MSKEVLLSIAPKWCELIARGEKTVEVRKTKPKIETPFKCYIYMTAGNAVYPVTINGNTYICSNNGGKRVIGEFVCDEIFDVDCDSIAPFDKSRSTYITDRAQMSRAEFWDYTGGRCAYGWHISDLVIYDKPKKLNEFSNGKSVFEFNKRTGMWRYTGMRRPPQSWCYVVEVSGGERMTVEQALEQIDNYGLLDEENPKELRDAVKVLCDAAEKQIPKGE